MKLKKFDDYYSLDSFITGRGYGGQLEQIIRMTRQNLVSEPRRIEIAKDMILKWWNEGIKEQEKHPTLKDHKLPYVLLWHLRKELEKRGW